MFAFRLCEHLKGFPHPDYLLPYLSARQFLDWWIYFKRAGRPGIDRNDILFGIIAAAITKRNLTDLMPYYRETFDEEMSVEDLVGKIAGAFPTKPDQGGNTARSSSL